MWQICGHIVVEAQKDSSQSMKIGIHSQAIINAPEKSACNE
jgi:hypothetical protein